MFTDLHSFIQVWKEFDCLANTFLRSSFACCLLNSLVIPASLSCVTRVSRQVLVLVSHQ